MIVLDPIGPDVPGEIARLLTNFRDALVELQAPGEPSPLYTTTQADLPPADDWTDCVLRVSDLDVLAHSNGTDWIRADTGAPI